MKHEMLKDYKLDSRYYDNTEEDVSKFKIHEVVSVHGREGSIRDIYVRFFRPPYLLAEEPPLRHLSFRMYEKEWAGMELSIFDLEKIEGRLIGQ